MAESKSRSPSGRLLPLSLFTLGEFSTIPPPAMELALWALSVALPLGVARNPFCHG